MRELYVELSDGVLVQFGPLEEIDAQDRAKKILKLRAVFHPAKTPATLSFVTSDRIVMDKNWQKGGAHVETGNSSGN